jgi:transposase
MAQHYDTAIIPARPKKPRDKAKVENAVLVAQRWILAALRNHVFFSIDDANDAVADKLEELNNRNFQKLDTTRRELYLSLDRPALKPLPGKRYEFAEWSDHAVHIDYHFEVDWHYYSVPFQLIHKRVDVRLTATTVEAFYKGRRVASHERSFKKGGYTTLPEHMPEAHRRYAEWTPTRLTEWASKAGPATAELASRIMEDRPHPEQGFRSCLGLMRLGKGYGLDRLEAASARALAIGSYSYKSVKSILKNGLDKQQLLPSSETENRQPVRHENIRGPEHYQ